MEPASAAPGAWTALGGGTRCGPSGPGRVGRDHAALSAHRSLCRACCCVVVHPLSHLYYQHTQLVVPEPVTRPWRPSPLALAFSSRSPSPQSPPGGRVGVRLLRASRSHRPVGPGLPCSRLSPLWLSSACLSPRRVRLLSSEPLCWRHTPTPMLTPVLTCDPSVLHPPAGGLFLPEDISPRAAFRTCFSFWSFNLNQNVTSAARSSQYHHPIQTNHRSFSIISLYFISLHST